MLFISHRGNLAGPSPLTENRPDVINRVLDLRCQVEIDVWYQDGQWFLGHDKPTYSFSEDWLWMKQHFLWIHCKNFEALNKLMPFGNILRCFWHQNDDYTLTSNGYIWTFPHKQIEKKSIIVVYEEPPYNFDCYAVCSDYQF